VTEPAQRRLSGADPGVEIALLDWGGDGPLALLHHANGFCAGSWGELAAGLRDRFHVVAMDARGHGASSKPEDPSAYRWDRFVADLAAVAAALAAESSEGRVSLAVGHSFGGTNLLVAASRHPDLFARLVLVDPVVRSPRREPRISAERHPGQPLAAGARTRRQVFASREEARGRWERHPFFGSWTPEARRLYARHGLRERSDGQVELACPREVEALVFDQGPMVVDPLGHAPSVKAPTLLLWAARGDFSRETYGDLAAAMADATIEELDAGHLVLMEQPVLVLESVLRFAAQGSTG